jgi:MoxR-like ATPase
MVRIDGIDLTLSAPEDHESVWLDYDDYALQLEAAWMRLSDTEPPLNPRMVGEPGLGKTTLACAVGKKLGREVYVFQCTMDTRPEDLLITPVLSAERRVEYRASAVVTAMVRGGVLLLDEGNRMPERSWASLAPLMDDRRYVESTVAGVKIHAHRDFRLCVTMNDDSSVYELPGYVQSRLKPKIEILPPPLSVQQEIVRTRCPGVSEELLREVFAELRRRAATERQDSTRDMLTLAQYAQKLKDVGIPDPLARAAKNGS